MRNNFIRPVFSITFLCMVMLLFSGCIVPEIFDIKLNVDKNGRFSFRYEGTLAFLPVVQEAIEGDLSKEDERDARAELEQGLKEDGFTNIKYQGKGRTHVKYEYSGKLDKFWEFMDLIEISRDQFGKVSIETNKIQLSPEETDKLRLKIDGKVTITTDAEVIKHNGRAKKGLIGKVSYNWRIKSVNDPMPEMVIMTVKNPQKAIDYKKIDPSRISSKIKISKVDKDRNDKVLYRTHKNLKPPSKKQKQDMAMMIIQSALEKDNIGETRSLSWYDDQLFEVTPLKNYKYKNLPCRIYKVVSYETGRPVTINDAGDACRSIKDGTWFPAYFFKSDIVVSGAQIMADLIGVDYSGTASRLQVSRYEKKRKLHKLKSKAIIDQKNNVALKTNPTTLKLKKEKAIKLVAYTLQNGKMGIEKTLSYEGKLLFGVTMTKSFTYLNKFKCKEYRVISYDSGRAITKLDPGKVCKIKGKWYPYILLTDSSRKSVPGDEFIEAMIGRWQ